jgi:hypothetical protein
VVLQHGYQISRQSGQHGQQNAAIPRNGPTTRIIESGWRRHVEKVPRLTWQPTPRNKINFWSSGQHYASLHHGGDGTGLSHGRNSPEEHERKPPELLIR